MAVGWSFVGKTSVDEQRGRAQLGPQGADWGRAVHPSLLYRRMDLVGFEDLCLFMFEDDNLYRIVVPDSAKKQPVSAFQARVRERGYSAWSITLGDVERVESAQRGRGWKSRVGFAVGRG